ncbi:hypothetical protein K1719_033501 [Acacia pycnantha]|nr:hypothetical protein K1719_033501 [Acacia pycnantha]
MAFLFWLLTFTSLSIFVLLLTFLLLLAVSLFAGKSIGDPNYAPVKGTVFHQLFYFNRLFDHQTETARSLRTFRLLGPGMSEHYTTDTKNVEHVLKGRFEDYSTGKYLQEIVRDLFGDGIFTVDGEKWKKQRRLASYEFSTRVLRDFSSSAFRTNAAKLVRLVSGFSEKGQVFDMQDILMRCTLDSIFKVGFGVELNCLEGTSKEGIEFMRVFDESNALVYWRYVDPFWKMKRYLNIGSEASLKNNVKFIDRFVHRLISTKRHHLAKQQNHHNEKEDILSRFLMESKKDPETMNDKYLRDIIMNFMIAGKDTSANTLAWFFYMMCKNPLVQEKVAQEVRDNVTFTQQETNTDEFVANITEATLDKMHYLHAALTETLRLYPAVPVNGRTAETDDILPDGYRVKKGDGVYYMAYAMGRMPYIWGPDADEFYPERWLKDSIFQPESPFKFTAFHAGPRICLGKDFAYRQMKIVAMALLRFFIFKLADETTSVTYKTTFTLHIDNGLPIRAIPRP